MVSPQRKRNYVMALWLEENGTYESILTILWRVALAGDSG
jgi:hypothetical protein